MLKNGLYSLMALAIDGADVEVGGVLILRDGKVYGGDSFVFYTGTYEDLDGRWRGELTSNEHTPTNRPIEEHVQRIVFSGTYDASEVEADATSTLASNAFVTLLRYGYCTPHKAVCLTCLSKRPV
jgi:hypothetical protein